MKEGFLLLIKIYSTFIGLGVENVAEADSHLDSLPAVLSECHLNNPASMPWHREASEASCQRLTGGLDVVCIKI